MASSNVLVEMGKTMVVPLEHGHWLDSFVAHLPDKYIKMSTQRNATPETFVPDMFSRLLNVACGGVPSCLADLR